MSRSTAELWRAALFVSLGLVETACSMSTGATPSEAERGREQDTAGDQATSAGERVEAAMNTVAGSFQCSADEPYLIGGFDTGRNRCREGAEHRASAAICPLADFLGLPPDAPAPRGRCKTDDECGAEQVCNCEVTPSGNIVNGVVVNGFSYGGGICVSARCHTDADCDGGALCVLAAVNGDTLAGCPVIGRMFVCQTNDDECDSADDCGDGLCLSTGGRLQCTSGQGGSCGDY